MIKILLLPIFLISFFGTAQIGLEHTFLNGTAARVVLENSGEKYYLFQKQTNTIEFYNADYSFWKSVPITVLPNTYGVSILHVSETKINPDDHIEIAYTNWAFPSAQSPQTRIINDEGTVLLSSDNNGYFMVDEQEGLPTKIISASGSSRMVYGLPEFSLEHTFTEGDVKRVKLENSGEKYYVLDKINSVVNLYNSDYSLWKTITLTKPVGYSIGDISLLSENQLNSDNLIEIGYSYYNLNINQFGQSKIINENGALLLTVSNAKNLRVSEIEGLPNKLFAEVQIESNNYFEDVTAVYSIPDLALENSHFGIVDRVKLENSGEKFYVKTYNHDTSELVVYNSDHSIWKTVAVPIQNPEETINGSYLTETQFGGDNQLKLVYTISSNTLDGGHYVTNVVKDDGTILLSVPEAYASQLSIMPNLPYKFIAFIYSGPFDGSYYFSRVYGADGVFAVKDFNNAAVSIAPNPAQNSINLHSKKTIVEVAVFDSRGILIEKYLGKNIKTLNVESLSTGIYLLHLTASNGEKSVSKIAVSH